MSTGFVVALALGVVVVMGSRALVPALPLRPHAVGLTPAELALGLLGLAVLGFHCGAMFFADATQQVLPFAALAQPRFSNGRSVRNAIERTRLRQARRLVELHRPLTRDDLITLTADDVYGSSVFDEAAENRTVEDRESTPQVR